MAAFIKVVFLFCLFMELSLGQYSCRTIGRESYSVATTTTTASLTKASLKKPWARFVGGEWHLVKDPNVQFRKNLEGKVQSRTTSAATAQTCCDLKCRSKIVPSADLKKSPYSSVVQVLLWTASFSIYCSGSVISPTIVLTAKHCLEDDDTEPIIGGYITGSYSAPGKFSTTVQVKRWRYFDTCNSTTSPDYGILYLATSTKIPPLPLAATLWSKTVRKVSVIGFPSVDGVPFGQMTVDSISVGTVGVDSDNYFEQQLISNPGGSGGPVYGYGSGTSVGQLAVATYIAWWDGQTCPANEQVLGGASVLGSLLSVRNLQRSIS